MFEPNSELAGTVRSILLVIGGILLAKGKTESAAFVEQYSPTIVGIALSLGSLGWSVYDKARVKREKAAAARLADKQIEVAVTMPPTATVEAVKIETMKQEVTTASPQGAEKGD
jgi:hypothetical protein